MSIMEIDSNKYYTPSIEEFYVGFKYEKYDERLATYSNYPNKAETTNWHRFTYDTKSIRLSQLDTHLYNKTIRTKYLDADDLKSLGWITDFLSGEMCTHKNSRWVFETFTLHNLNGSVTKGFVIKDLKNIFGNQQDIFRGQIKNYNELQKLMKQLGI